MDKANIIIGVGLVLTLVGAGCGAYGTWLSQAQAIHIGVARFSGGTTEEQLKLPSVKNLLRQSKFAMGGFLLIGVGTVLQIVGLFLTKS